MLKHRFQHMKTLFFFLHSIQHWWQVKYSVFVRKGQEQFDRIRQQCFREVDVVIFCFAASEEGSLDHIRLKWLKDVNTVLVRQNLFLFINFKMNLAPEKLTGKFFPMKIEHVCASTLILET